MHQIFGFFVLTSKNVKLGDPVFTIGYPNVFIQGVSPKLTKGEINSLAGIQDDPRYFQVNVAIQPGNSGSPLINMQGNVIGLLALRLKDSATFNLTGMLPQNVNYAVKSSYLLPLLETIPNINLETDNKENTSRSFDDAVKQAELATVMILAE